MSKEEFIKKYLSVLPECTTIKELPEILFYKAYVILECKVHGEYKKRVDTVSEYGCKACNRKKVKTEYDNEWKDYCTKLHNGKYDYTNTIVGDVLTHSDIKCNTCNTTFKQSPSSHKSGKGCPKCGKEKMAKSTRKEIEFVKEKAKKLGFNYDFSKSVYKTCKDAIQIVCDKGHAFWKTPDVLLNAKQGCAKSSIGKNTSKAEKEVLDFIQQYRKCITNDREVLDGLELDIIIKGMKVAIEFNGIYWHRDGNKKITHADKNFLCARKGIHLIQIYEDDWRDRREVVKTKLLDSLMLEKSSYILAPYTDCKIQEEKKLDLKQILKDNSLNYDVKFDGAYSMYYNKELLGLAYYVIRKGKKLIFDIFRPVNAVQSQYFLEFVKYFSGLEEEFEISCSLDWIDDIFLMYNKNEVKYLSMSKKKYIVNNKLVKNTDKENAKTLTKSGYVIYKM